MRKQIAAGNWKMNTTWSDAEDLCMTVANAQRPLDVLTILGVPSVFLQALNEKAVEKSQFYLAAQNCHQSVSGAYTGEISADMLRSIQIQYVILGHSERREYFGEGNEIVYKKLLHAHETGLKPIFCCGEPLAERMAGSHKEYVLNQLQQSLLLLNVAQMLDTIVAYEPIWAIGTGETASSEQAQEMHQTIRQAINDIHGSHVSEQISILYGGSVKGSNAKEIFSQNDVDGGLVGGASLNAEEFLRIIHSF